MRQKLNVIPAQRAILSTKDKTTENFGGLKLCYCVSCKFLSSNSREQRVSLSENQHHGNGCLILKITDKKLKTPFRSPNLQIQSTLHVSFEKTLHIYHPKTNKECVKMRLNLEYIYIYIYIYICATKIKFEDHHRNHVWEDSFESNTGDDAQKHNTALIYKSI